MYNKIKLLLSKGLGFIYILLIYRFRIKNRRFAINNKKILVIFGGHLGNAVLNIDTLIEIRKAYSRKDGWEIIILCNKGIRTILECIADMSEYEFLDYSFPYDDGGTRIGSVLKTVHFMKGMKFEKIIVNLAHVLPLASYIVASTPSNDSIGVFDDVSHRAEKNRDIEHNFGDARWYFERAYKTQIRVDYNTQEVVRQKLILEHLNIDYKVRVFPIRKLCDYKVSYTKYFTVTLDTANLVKRWSPDKFAEVINMILNKYQSFDVCITGGENAEHLFYEMIDSINEPNRVHNYIGKTSFTQWVELLRGSLFHFGVDSGSIHVASSVGTQAFCLIGVRDGTRVLPYRIEDYDDNTCSPICIYMEEVTKLPCYGCIPKYGLMGSENEECLKRCQNNKVCYCLDKITPIHAFDIVNEWLIKKIGVDIYPENENYML